MPRYICHLNNKYFEWSTVVDAPVTYGMDELIFTEYYESRYGTEGVRDLPDRLRRAKSKGTSSMLDKDLQELIGYNRAGYQETCLTLDEIERIYLIEQRSPVVGEGVKVNFED